MRCSSASVVVPFLGGGSITWFVLCVASICILEKKLGQWAEVRTIAVRGKSRMVISIWTEALMCMHSIVDYQNRNAQKQSWRCTVLFLENHVAGNAWIGHTWVRRI